MLDVPNGNDRKESLASLASLERKFSTASLNITIVEVSEHCRLVKLV